MADPTTETAAKFTSFMEAQAHEAFCIWECACDAWRDYIAALTSSAGPEAVLQANTKLAFDTLALYGRATSVHLAEHGLRAPLLTDA